MAKKYFSRLQLRGDNYELEEARVPGEKKRIIEGKVFVDYSCFRKTKEEKELLKLAKLQSKAEILHK
jgi:hypothetical protein